MPSHGEQACLFSPTIPSIASIILFLVYSDRKITSFKFISVEIFNVCYVHSYFEGKKIPVAGIYVHFGGVPLVLQYSPTSV
jgi:hypothetical protein